jgi:hypothetical protein
MRASPRRSHLVRRNVCGHVRRFGLIALIGATAVVFLSLASFAGAIGLVIAAAVLIDTLVLARARRPPPRRPSELDTPDQITVDLRRRS